MTADEFLEPPGERRGAPRVARDDKNRVVAADGADGFGELRAVDRDRQRLRLAGAGADDDELLDPFHAAKKRGGGTLERRQRRGGRRFVGTHPLIRAVARALDEAELLDVAGNG